MYIGFLLAVAFDSWSSAVVLLNVAGSWSSRLSLSASFSLWPGSRGSRLSLLSCLRVSSSSPMSSCSLLPGSWHHWSLSSPPVCFLHPCHCWHQKLLPWFEWWWTQHLSCAFISIVALFNGSAWSCNVNLVLNEMYTGQVVRNRTRHIAKKNRCKTRRTFTPCVARSTNVSNLPDDVVLLWRIVKQCTWIKLLKLSMVSWRFQQVRMMMHGFHLYLSRTEITRVMHGIHPNGYQYWWNNNKLFVLKSTTHPIDFYGKKVCKPDEED